MFTLQQALDAIKDKPEFQVKENPLGFTCIDYYISDNKTFLNEDGSRSMICENLRGTKFDTKTGLIVCLGYHKFHNYMENPDYAPEKINLSEKRWFLEKLDGSMIATLWLNDQWYFTTRAGITDVSDQALEFVTSNADRLGVYDKFIREWSKLGFTCIFEFCSRLNQVVVDYPETKLVLTGIRSNLDGHYIDYDNMVIIAQDSNIPVVNEFDVSGTVEQIAEKIKVLPASQEGIVVRFENGFMVKIKGGAYVSLHRAKDGLRFEKNVVEMILTNLVDDTLALLDESTKSRLEAYRDTMVEHIKLVEAQIEREFENLKALPDAKTFAFFAKRSRFDKFLFAKRNGKNLTVRDVILKHCGSQSKIEEVRYLIGEQRWNAPANEVDQ